MEILKQSRDMDKRELYLLTRGQDTIMVKTLSDGDTFNVADYVLYRDINGKGDENEVLAMLSGGKVYATISNTFKSEFFYIYDLMCDDDVDSFNIKVVKGVSNAGREYVTCTLD